jgi:hypothetical protein
MPLVDQIFSADRVGLVCVPYTAFDATGETVIVSEVC